MTVKTMGVLYTGDANEAVSETERLHAAIDRLPDGKTIISRVRTIYEDVGSPGGAARNLGAMADAHERAGRAARDHDRATDSFGRRVADTGRRVGDFSGRMRDAADDVGDFHSTVRRSDGLARFDRDLIGTSRSVRALGSETERTARPMRELGSGRGPSGLREIESGARGAMLEMRDLGDGVYRTVDAVGSIVRTGSGVSRLGSVFAESAGEMMDMGSIAGRGLGVVAKGMGLVTAGAGVAAAGAGIVTGAVGAMGVASVGAFGLVGAGMGMAAGTFVGHAVEVLSESAKFRGEFKAISRDMQSWQEDTYEPVGEAVVGLADQFRAAGPSLGAPIKAGLGAARDAVLDAGPDLVRGSQTIADSIGRITTDTAPSIGVLARSVPALAASTTGAVEEITRSFNAGFQEQWPAAVPHVQRLTASVGEFGAELMRTGAANLVPFVNDLESLTEHATTMTRNLGPSMPAAMGAFTDVGNMIMDAAGSPQVTEGIALFSSTIERQRGPLTAMLSDLAEGGFAAGSAFVDGLGDAEPAVKRMTDAISENREGISGIVRDTTKLVAGAVELGANTLGGMQSYGQSINDELDATLGVKRDSSGAMAGLDLAHSPLATALSNVPGLGALISPFVQGARAAQGAPAVPGLPGAAEQPGVMGQTEILDRMYPGRGHMVPQHEIPGRFGTTPYSVPDLPFSTNEQGQMTGPRAQAINEKFGFDKDAPITTVPLSEFQPGPVTPPSPLVTPGMPESRVPALPFTPPVMLPGPAFDQPMLPPGPPADSMDALLNGQVKGRVGSSLGGVVRRQIQDTAPEVEAAGADMGASATAGLAQGIERNIERVETVTRRTSRRIIDVTADTLDSHSPSREMDRLGYTAPQGLAGGVDRGAPLVERSGQRMAQGLLGAASPADLNRAGLDAARSYATGLDTGMSPAAGQGAGMFPAGTPPTPAPPPTGVGGPGARAGLDPYQPAPGQPAGQQPPPAPAYTGVGGPGSQAGLVDPIRRAPARDIGPQPEAFGATSDTFLARQAAHNKRAAEIRERAQKNKERALRDAVGPGMSDKQFSTMLDTRQPGKTSFSYDSLTPATTAPRGSDWAGPNPGGQAATAARAQGKDVGMSYGQGVSQGLGGAQPKVMGAAKGLAASVGAATRDELGIRSPSKVGDSIMSDYADGLGGGLERGLGRATDGALRVASDRGLEVGFTYARQLVGGADVVLKRSNFESISMPQIESEQARAALGAMGLLPAAGAGASVAKNPSISLSGGTATLNQTIRLDLPIVLNGEVIGRLQRDVVNERLVEFATRAVDAASNT